MTTIDYTLYPSLDPSTPYNQMRSRKGFVIYHEPAARWWNFGYTVYHDGNYVGTSQTLWGAHRIMHRHALRKPSWEGDIVYAENQCSRCEEEA